MPTSPPRILIVDDHPGFRSVAREMLQTRGYAVVAEADCSSAAFEAVDLLAPDAVLLDVCLGAESGLDAARSLTRTHPELPVLLVSADELKAWPEQVRECGARGFVLKSRLQYADLAALWRSGDGVSAAAPE